MSHGELIDNGGVFLRDDLLRIVDSEFFQDKSNSFFRLKEVLEPISSEEKLAFFIIDMVKDTNCEPKIRIKVGEILRVLEKRDDAVTVLLPLAIDSNVNSSIRLDAASYLSKSDMNNANEACQAYLSIANDPNVEVKTRLKSAEFIEIQAKKRVLPGHQTIAKDSGVEAESRVEAVKNWLFLEMEDDDGAKIPNDAYRILLHIAKSRRANVRASSEATRILDYYGD